MWEAAAHLDETEGEISKGGQCQPLPRGHRGFAIGRLVRPLGFILLIFIGGHPEEGAVGGFGEVGASVQLADEGAEEMSYR